MSWTGSRRTGAVARLVLLALLVAWSMTLAIPMAKAADKAFTISDPEITESSGLATDSEGGFYWTVNDSGDTPRAFAIDPDGSTRGVLRLQARSTDIEAVARTRNSLWLGDIGDNDEKRDLITVFRIRNPQPDSTPSYNAWDFRYSDGRAHDAEAMLVDAEGTILIVTKGEKGAIWKPDSTPSGAVTTTLSKVADAPGWITDGTVLRDGTLALRSYTGIYLLDPSSYRVTASVAAPLQQQGESITQDLTDDDTLLVGSEGRNSAVLKVAVPTSKATIPESSVPPTATPSASPSATSGGEKSTSAPADPEAEDGGDQGSDRSGTFLALGLAALGSLVAGALVLLVPRRGGTTTGESGVDAAVAASGSGGRQSASATDGAVPEQTSADADGSEQDGSEQDGSDQDEEPWQLPADTVEPGVPWDRSTEAALERGLAPVTEVTAQKPGRTTFVEDEPAQS